MKYLRGSEIKQIEIAEDFYEAYQRCFKSDQNNHIVAIPGFANGMFACEIYFKLLVGDRISCLKGKEKHNLKKLFDILDDEKKAELKSIKIDPRYTLEGLLGLIGDGFIEWRYIYEKGNESFGGLHPFEYTEAFIQTYLPAIKEMAEKYEKNKNE